MTTESIDELFVQGVQELYYAEQQLVDAMETLAEETSDEAASRAFAEHRDETQQQVERLEQVFEQIGEEPQAKEEQVVNALIQEHEQFAQENEGDVLDRYNMELGQKTEHYEIAAYGSLASLAQKTGQEEAADILAETLREEEEALTEVTKASEQFDREQVAGD
jgi:ferritin-like metal-binding protein YciE